MISVEIVIHLKFQEIYSHSRGRENKIYKCLYGLKIVIVITHTLYSFSF